MCLYVTHVPDGRRPNLVVKCFKSLCGEAEALVRGFTTEYQAMAVPPAGWLLPKRPTKRREWWARTEINSGVIHAYCHQAPIGWARRQHHEAYAIDVLAWDESWSVYESLVCRALYIPDADTNEDRRAATVAKLDKWSRARKNYATVAALRAAFPVLTPKYLPN